MKPPWRICPRCGTALDKKGVALTRSFECPNCGERLIVKQVGYKARSLTVYLLSPLLAYISGLRGLGFVIVSVLALWPLGLASKLIANALFPPWIVVRPSNDPEINRCPKCGVDLGNRLERNKPFKCPQCGETLKIEFGKGTWLLMAVIVLWLFVGTPLASLLGYEIGMRGFDLALLPLAVFLSGGATFGLINRMAGKRIFRLRIEAAPPSMTGSTQLSLR